MSFEDRNMIILGDTNLYKDDEDIVELIEKQKFRESDGLKGKFTNVSQSEIYDRIFLNVEDYFEIGKDEHGNEIGDVFHLFDYVYKDEQTEIAKYHSLMKKHKKDPSTLTNNAKFNSYFHRYWKRDQMSDHLPVWLEIKTNSSIGFLKNTLKKF